MANVLNTTVKWGEDDESTTYEEGTPVSKLPKKVRDYVKENNLSVAEPDPDEEDEDEDKGDPDAGHSAMSSVNAAGSGADSNADEDEDEDTTKDDKSKK